MGNICIKDRKQQQQTLFDPPELNKLNAAFDHYCDLYPDTRKKRMLSQTIFEEIFIENPEFGRKLFKLLENFGQKEKYISRETLFPLLEVLIKDSSTANQLKCFDKFELVTLISLKQTEFLQGKEELHKLKLTFLDTIQIVNDLLRIRLAGDQFTNVDERVSRALLDQIFKKESGVIEWFELAKVLKSRLKGASLLIKRYIQNKFMFQPMPIFPTLSTNSYLLNEDWAFQLLMAASDTKIRDSIKLELIYSSVKNHEGYQFKDIHPFKQMIESMLNCGLPTIILFQHEEQFTALHDQSLIKKQHIFGAISNQRWFDSAQPQGDLNDCIFQLYPNFQVYKPKRERTAKKNFCYLNTRDTSKPIGIGFGYGEKSRIWIDQDIENGSYCTSQDDSYENGDLVSKHIKKLQINVVEVWSIVHAQPEQTISLMEAGEGQQLMNDVQQAIDSNANYYWVKKEEEEEKAGGLFADFYWMKGNQKKQQSKSVKITRTARNYEQRNDSEIAYQLIGDQQTKPQYDENQPIIETQQSTLKRSARQRPVLDFNTQKARSSYNPPTQALYNDIPSNDRNQLFGTQLEQTKHVQDYDNSNDYPKKRKTAADVIRDYDLRKSAKKDY